MILHRLLSMPLLGGTLVLLATSANAAPGAAPTAPEFDVTLAPGAPDASGHVPYVDVTIRAQQVHADANAPLFTLPLTANTLVTSAKDLTDLAFSDVDGPITVRARDSVQDSSNSLRSWIAARAVTGTVKVHYRVPIDAAAPPLALPQYEMRTEDGTFSAAANAFLMLPADTTSRRPSVHWDFAAYGAQPEGGAKPVGASSLGLGDARGRVALTPERLDSMYFMAGHPGTLGPAADGFFGVWQGKPAFAMAPTMDWAAKLHRYYGQFFGYVPPSFGVFGRTNTRNPGSGIGLLDSFAFTFNATSTPADLRSLLAHEMVHSWVNSLDGSMDQPDGLDRSWFGEGLAVYYQRTLPYRAGMISADDFLADLNDTAARYYTNARIGTPNAEIPEGFWRDTRIRVLPYDRGSLYFARVDAEIRAASGGKRSLDDLVRAMLAARRAGKAMNEALYRRLLEAQLGDAGIAEFDAMLAGAVQLPPSDAFGPQFRRITRPMRRFNLGFDPAVLVSHPRIVRGLIAGSQAEQAGLRDGDEILNTFPQDKLQGEQEGWLTLEVRRAGKTFSIRYQPRGETVEAYQWVKVASR